MLVSVPYVCYRNGVRSDVQTVIGMAHERGAKVLVDVYQQVAHLTARIAEETAAGNWKLTTPAAPDRHGAMMSIASTDAPLLVQRLGEAGIVVSERDNKLRVSPHFYNNDADINVLFKELEKNAELLVAV